MLQLNLNILIKKRGGKKKEKQEKKRKAGINIQLHSIIVSYKILDQD